MSVNTVLMSIKVLDVDRGRNRFGGILKLRNQWNRKCLWIQQIQIQQRLFK
jgi:hypothetical protein